MLDHINNWTIFPITWGADKGQYQLLSNSSKIVFHYKNHEFDNIQKKTSYRNLDALTEYLGSIPLENTSKQKRVFHFCFELGHLFLDLQNLISDDQLLFVEIEYADSRLISESQWRGYQSKEISVGDIKGVDYGRYKKSFDKIFQHLLKGDCYQVNLTFPYITTLGNATGPWDILNHFWKESSSLGKFAHATYIKDANFLLISNSPECLFTHRQQRGGKARIYSMPIKGSIPFNDGSDKLSSVWEELVASKKDRGELDIITDLVRNDLSKITRAYSNVVKRRAPLVVPNILHQYSLINLEVENKVDLYMLLQAMFPGGSITGAPKKRVMEIIHDVELVARSFYCGTTFISDEKISMGSINIRTAVVDMKTNELVYGAGGGITLLSECGSEYAEMQLKLKSFFGEKSHQNGAKLFTVKSEFSPK
ncbi:MAG: chorismate-binding protein [Bacteriovoracaceae bacterium]|nr:chorismate-binding protein [Bacteriovoracaceae bacterium]